ncbi:MAG: hypothetical protein JOZ16_12905, partial [Methylobacteriaceae bacterium]|nr:hypothetical protein [Methylobacteriaceae bacterium]
WWFLTALLLAGAGMCAWQIRYFAFAAPLAAITGGAASIRLAAWAAGRIHSVKAPVWTLVFCLPFAASTYMALLPEARGQRIPVTAGPASGASDGAPCLRPETLQALNALPPSLLLAPIDSGGYLLALTHHSVLAGAYHRDNHGNRAAIDIFEGPIGEAEIRLRDTGARYLVSCRGQDEVLSIVTRAPDGLLARLQRGDVPSWLRPVPLPNGVLQVYELAETPDGNPK